MAVDKDFIEARCLLPYISEKNGPDRVLIKPDEKPSNTIKLTAIAVLDETDSSNKPRPRGRGLIGINRVAPYLSIKWPEYSENKNAILAYIINNTPHSASDQPFDSIKWI